MPAEDTPKGRLLLVIPSVLSAQDGSVEVDKHFASNLQAYLEHFDHVTVACPSGRAGQPNTVRWADIPGSTKGSVVVLPEPYREDRYLRNRRAVRKSLRALIEDADYLLVSPHSAFDWSTLAAKTAIELEKPYDMEADWDLERVSLALWADMPWGLNKLRKYLWIKSHARSYKHCMRHSSVALLQGADVFAAYERIAPNPHKVLNIQIADGDRIPTSELQAKLDRVRSGAPLRIVYTGRVVDMKGPEDWCITLGALKDAGLDFRATWYGGGPLLMDMQAALQRRGLQDKVAFAGNVEREVAAKEVRGSDLFLFCHKTLESPRCLVEALAAGTPIIGYESLYARDLVAAAGGGKFAPLGDWRQLSLYVASLDADRVRLAELIQAAYESSRSFDRERAIRERIALIKGFAGPRNSGQSRPAGR